MRFSNLVCKTFAVLALSSAFGGYGPQGSGTCDAFYKGDSLRAAAAVANNPSTHSHTTNDSSGLLVHAEPDATLVPPESAEKFAFEAEVHRMLDIVVNSLYQNKDVFLRELISNASDALDKIRYLLLTQADIYKDGAEMDLQVQIEYDALQGTVTIRDTGVGMTRQDMVQNLGTVARSGTTKFMEALKESGNAESTVSQIGQFGVGFYSAFLVADRVTVASKNPTDPVQHVWESANGSGDFLIYPDPRGNSLTRGTEITLHLKEDCREYLDPLYLKELAQHYSEFVTHPISLRTTRMVEVEVEPEEKEETTKEATEDDELEVGEETDASDEDDEDKPKETKEVMTHTWDVLNGNPAIWTREKEDITEEEYQAFWHVLNGNDFSNATDYIHFTAEGNINFKSLMYLPDEVPTEYSYGNVDRVPGAIRLYVRKVLIGDSFELLPKYLGFIRGVVDSDDLPLNVNRETLQESKILQVIKKKLVRKAIDLIRQLAKSSESEETDSADEDGEAKLSKYDEWYQKFSPNIKLGVIEDEPNRGKLLKLLRFETSKSNGKLISLPDYKENMKDWQDEIYVLGGSSADEISKSAFLEPFKEKDLEVIYLTDAIDEYLIRSVRDFDGSKFAQASSENIKFKDEDEDLVKRREKYYKNQFAPLVKYLRKLYHGSVLRVQVAKRSLGSVPAVVTSSDFGNSANMERILRAQAFQHGVNPSSLMALKILEVNPRHPIILKLLEGCPPEDDDEAKDFEVSSEVKDSALLMLDMALLNGGFPVSDPDAHNKRLTKVLQKNFGLESLALEPEVNPPIEDDEPPEAEGLGGLNMEDFNIDDLDLDSLMKEAPDL